MTSRSDTVSTETSGADSVPPSLAGWEETKENLKRGSSPHEAHCSRYGLAGRARPFGRRLDQDVGLQGGRFNTLNGGAGRMR